HHPAAGRKVPGRESDRVQALGGAHGSVPHPCRAPAGVCGHGVRFQRSGRCLRARSALPALRPASLATYTAAAAAGGAALSRRAHPLPKEGNRAVALLAPSQRGRTTSLSSCSISGLRSPDLVTGGPSVSCWV